MSIFESTRLDDWRLGRKKIKALKEARQRTIVIHYSCESFINNHNRSPRITSIVVKNRDNGSSITFSLHLIAQEKGVDLNVASDKQIDTLERIMLQNFYSFQKRHLTFTWVHWNMRNALFGFEAIANRFKILGGNPKRIEDQFRFDLPEIFRLIHTNKFEEHESPSRGQLLNLAIRNNISRKGALTGEEEAIAFENKAYLNLQMSTMRKVEIIDRLLDLEERGLLKTAESPVQRYGLTLPGIVEIIRNNVYLLGFFTFGIFILGSIIEVPIQDWSEGIWKSIKSLIMKK